MLISSRKSPLLAFDIHSEVINRGLKHSMIELHEESGIEFQPNFYDYIHKNVKYKSGYTVRQRHCELLLSVREHLRDITCTWKCLNLGTISMVYGHREQVF